MTNAQVEAIITNAVARNREVSRRSAKAFLGSKELLASEPGNDVAQKVVENFSRYITTGEQVISFAEFVLPEFETDEERATTVRRKLFMERWSARRDERVPPNLTEPEYLDEEGSMREDLKKLFHIQRRTND